MSKHNRLWLFPAVALVALAMTAGCDRVKQLEMQNRTLSERLEQCQGQNAQLQSEKDQLANRLSAVEADNQQLSSANQELKYGLKELQQKYHDALEKRRPIIVSAALPEELNQALKDFAAQNPRLAEFDEQNGMVKLKSDLTFPPGGYLPRQQAADLLRRLVSILQQDGAKKFSVYIAGHTDDLPIVRPATKRMHPNNWYLSAHRAIGVQQVLVDAGLEPDRIAVMGFSKYHPIAPNKPNNGGNEKNRRVEIWIVPPGQFLTPAAETIEPMEPTDQ